MSQYKSALHAPQPLNHQDDYKYRPQLVQLKEVFPSWSNDDLRSLLNDVAGDIEIATTRITDGTAEQWGEVTRKKDKKSQPASHGPKETFSGRGDFRGGRGGRGGRAVARGGARGRGGVPRNGTINGHSVVSRTSTPKPVIQNPTADNLSLARESVDSAPPEANNASANDHVHDGEHTKVIPTAKPVASPANGSVAHLPAKPVTKLASQPPRLSWAQIARQPEKPVAPPPPPHQTVASAPSLQPVSSSAITPVSTPSNPPEVESAGWEEPTTAQPPTWEEPADKPAVSVTESSWPPALAESVEPSDSETKADHVPDEKPEELSITEPEPPVEPPVELPAPIAVSLTEPIVTVTASPKSTTRPNSVSHRSSARYKLIDQPVVMPSSFGAGVEKVGMQFGSLNLNGDNVPESPGSGPEAPAPVPPSPPVAASTVSTLAPAASVATQAPKAQEVKPVETTPPPPPPPTTAPAATLTSSLFQQQQTPATPLSHQPSQAASQITPPIQLQHTSPPSAVPSVPIQPSAISTHHASSTHSHTQTSIPSHNTAQASLPHFVSQAQTQHALSSNHHQTQQQQQQQHLSQSSHTHHQYGQHGLSTHIEQSQQSQSTPQTQPQAAAVVTSHANYFRQNELASSSPYFHTPTPPSSQSQETGYSSFGQLSGQAQHQQSSHLPGFGSDYGYTDNPRGFYDSYGQQNTFSGRSMLTHDDVKVLPGTQQSTASATLPTNTQTSQQHPSSQSAQPQSAGGQAPQQGYPPPHVPYYYTHPYPQNQYYGSPYSSGYGVPQPFVKYPTMFQPGPPGPASAPSPAGKQPGSNVGVGVNVQPQSNPYNQGVYQQGSYDDYSQHPLHSQHQHQQHSHSHSLGLGQGVGVDYGKQLYGASAQGGIQGFMSAGQTTGGSTGVPSNGPRGGNSPENAYKPYINKDVGVNVAGGRGGVQQNAPVQPSQAQSQGQSGQGPQSQGFYGGNRFTSAAGGVGGVPPQTTHHQQAGPQGHLGYPQSGNEGNFYAYQPRQQQGYW